MISLPTVWIVDDDEDDRFFLTQALQEVPVMMLVKELSDGEEVLPALEEAPTLPRLILLDLNMARMNGFDVLAQLRTIPAYQNLPVIVLTTSSSKVDEERSLTLGANEFLTKPASLHTLIHMLQRVMATWSLN